MLSPKIGHLYHQLLFKAQGCFRKMAQKDLETVDDIKETMFLDTIGKLYIRIHG